MLESVKAARTGAVEQATRDSERAQIATASPRELGQILAAERGFTGDQWSCLDSLWQRESNWNPNAENPSSGAYGIPQSLPGSKMATVAADWRTNPATQITWGLNYITDRYGTPCGAWGHSQSVGWY
ncbi:MAG: transglycosylase SLT domain-containing protein [Sporichthyaceae bacterium]|nr:transglycosylase SLT domain-containing protein [Sporichthyaceae bacterium]